MIFYDISSVLYHAKPYLSRLLGHKLENTEGGVDAEKEDSLHAGKLAANKSGEVCGATQYFQGSKVDDNYTVIDKKMGGEYTMHISFPYDERMACSSLISAS